MNKRKNVERTDKIAVDVKELSQIIGVGTGLARKIGEDAKARVSYGNRNVYIISKVREYLESKCEV